MSRELRHTSKLDLFYHGKSDLMFGVMNLPLFDLSAKHSQSMTVQTTLRVGQVLKNNTLTTATYQYVTLCLFCHGMSDFIGAMNRLPDSQWVK